MFPAVEVPEVSDILSPVLNHLHETLGNCRTTIQEVKEMRDSLDQYLVRLKEMDHNAATRESELYRQEVQTGRPHNGNEFKSRLDPKEFNGNSGTAFDAIMQELGDALKTAETSGEVNSIRTAIALYAARVKHVDAVAVWMWPRVLEV